MYKEEQLVNTFEVERISQHEQERTKIKTTTQTAVEKPLCVLTTYDYWCIAGGEGGNRDELPARVSVRAAR
jgi:hypothetical protein